MDHRLIYKEDNFKVAIYVCRPADCGCRGWAGGGGGGTMHWSGHLAGVYVPSGAALSGVQHTREVSVPNSFGVVSYFVINDDLYFVYCES